MKTLYTINGFFELLTTSSQYKRQSTEEKKLLLFDRCNWFITSVACINIQREQPYEEFVNLHSSFLKRYLTNRNYKDIENCLLGLGILQINNTYSTNRFSKSFRLTDKAVKLGIEDIDIKTEKFRRQYNRINEERIREVLDNPLYKKIATNTAKLSVIEKQDFLVDAYFDPFDYVKENEFDRMTDAEVEMFLDQLALKLSKDKNYINKKKRYEDFYKRFVNLNNVDDPKKLLEQYVNYLTSSAKSGRVYHTFAFMPRQVRKCLRTKTNNHIWEVDMSSAQPSIIFLEWLKWTKSNWSDTFQDEYDLCLSLVLNGGIYKYVKENSEYFSKIQNYYNLKKEILTIINAKNYRNDGNKALIELFPNVFNWINNIKDKEDYKKVSHIGQSAEANIFVEVYKKIPKDKFALIIHDCILTTKRDVKLIKSLLEKRVRELYPIVIRDKHSLDKLFKEELVSIPDNELMENKLIKFYNKI
ncbi:hypothetical protein [Polaribacter sp.]|uniref:hypothetical protein n=1 Tax=Polaribacter sp. TaxID=1920175 RepID=UPI0025E0E770|nr:hypothetical protein [Polaribacter sp.]